MELTLKDYFKIWSGWKPTTHYPSPSLIAASYSINREKLKLIPKFTLGEFNDLVVTLMGNKPLCFIQLNHQKLPNLLTDKKLFKEALLYAKIHKFTIYKDNINLIVSKDPKLIKEFLKPDSYIRWGKLLGYPSKSIKLFERNKCTDIKNKKPPKFKIPLKYFKKVKKL